MKYRLTLIVLFFASISLFAAGDAFTINSSGDQVIFASQNFSRPAVLPDDTDFHLFGWSGQSRYRGTDFYGVSLVRTNDAYAGAFLDWGTLLPQQEHWRTLTADEWIYVLTSRTNASSLCGEATIGGQKGLVLLPDTFTVSIAQAVADWAKMESKGAVFLPYQGYRDGADVLKNEGEDVVGYYWTATSTDSKQSIYININQKTQVAGNRYLGCSVTWLLCYFSTYSETFSFLFYI